MPPERQIYLLDPQQIPPETIAVTFAKTSRSPQSFREIAAELSAAKSAEFHEKWVVGYGHASVAEHAVLHVALENISRLAVETIESNRLASYTEKSTRYQKWDPDHFYRPVELRNNPLEQVFTQTCRILFAAYQQALPAVRQVVMQEMPRLPEESESAWERRIRSDYVDVCRFLLPAAALANVGMTINARALEHAISKMLSSPLEEIRAIGAEVKTAAQTEVPTLVKYAEAKPYLETARTELSQTAIVDGQFSHNADWCHLAYLDSQPDERILAAALYRYGELSLTAAIARVQALPQAERARLAMVLLGNLGKYDIPLRELEYAHFTFDVVMDQGAYFEVKRHRMMTQTAQTLSTRLGFAVPRRIQTAGLEDVYREVMEHARQSYEEIAASYPEAAAYIVPNAYNRRVLLDLNLRSARHFINLRSAPNAHFSVRRVAGRLAEEIRAVCPLLGGLLQNAENTQNWRQIEAENFIQIGFPAA